MVVIAADHARELGEQQEPPKVGSTLLVASSVPGGSNSLCHGQPEYGKP
jgi:hypothetical protein